MAGEVRSTPRLIWTWTEVESYLKGAARASEYEECGLIGVNPFDLNSTRSFRVWPIHNAHISPQHNYLMDHLDQRLAFEEMDRLAMILWGAYHTHPHDSGSAEPSATDREWSYPARLRMVIATADEVSVWVRDGDEVVLGVKPTG